MKLGKKLTKRTNNEVKFKNQPKLNKPNVFKSFENYSLLTKISWYIYSKVNNQ